MYWHWVTDIVDGTALITLLIVRNRCAHPEIYDLGWVIFDHKVAGTRDKVKEGEKKMFQHLGLASGGYYEKSNLKYKKEYMFAGDARGRLKHFFHTNQA